MFVNKKNFFYLHKLTFNLNLTSSIDIHAICSLKIKTVVNINKQSFQFNYKSIFYQSK